MSELNFENPKPALIQPPIRDPANQKQGTEREPHGWTVGSGEIPELVLLSGDYTTEDTVGIFFDGERMVEFVIDDLSPMNNQPTILGAGRPEHWDEDTFPEDVRKAHYEHGFKATFQKIAQVSPEVKQVTVTLNGDLINDAFINTVILGCGRPKDWTRSFITWGKDSSGNIRNHHIPSEDPDDALRWVENGGNIEIVYDRPLRLVGQTAVQASLKAVTPD